MGGHFKSFANAVSKFLYNLQELRKVEVSSKMCFVFIYLKTIVHFNSEELQRNTKNKELFKSIISCNKSIRTNAVQKSLCLA